MNTTTAKRLPGAISFKRPDIWSFSAFVITLCVALPVLAIFYLALWPEENIWPHLWATVLPIYVENTLILMAGVGILATLAGVGCAWLVSMCDIPGRRFLEWFLLMPFAVPAYVIAYVYTDMLEYAGFVQTFLRDLFGWQSARDYWFPEIRSMGGAIIMMSLVLYPYIYMLARASFLEQSASLMMASRSLGHSPLSSFFRISIPMARPAIAVGLSLVLMETLNDFGTVDYFAVRTLTAGLYDTWLNMSNLGGAAQIASLMLIFVVALISSERLSRRKQKLYEKNLTGQPLERIQLSTSGKFLALAFCLAPAILGFVVPVSVLGHYAYSYFEESWTPQFLSYAINSLSLSFSTAIATAAIGLLLAYAKRLSSSPVTAQFTNLSSLGYAMPGAVLAIGVVIPLAAFDNGLDGLMREYFDTSTGLMLTGTGFAIVFAYTVRFLAIASGAMENSLAKVTPSMDMAARSLGASKMLTLLKIHIPIVRRGLLTAMLIVFVDCMKELPATLILRPFNFETLATQVYQYASDELLEQSALSALIIVLAGVLPVIVLSRSITKDHRRTSSRSR